MNDFTNGGNSISKFAVIVSMLLVSGLTSRCGIAAHMTVWPNG